MTNKLSHSTKKIHEFGIKRSMVRHKKDQMERLASLMPFSFVTLTQSNTV